MFEPKIPAIAALIGFVLSLLAGLASGAPVSTVFLRAMLMAVLFALMALVIRFVIERFLPELAEVMNGSAPEGGTSGSTIDISIDGGIQEINPFAAGVSDDRGLDSTVPDFLSGESGQASGFSPKSNADDFEDAELMSDEVPESTPARKDAVPFREHNSDISGKAEQGRPAVPEAQRNSHSSFQGDKPTPGLDVLPDMEDFQPARGIQDDDVPDPSGEPSNPNLVFREGIYSGPTTEDNSVESDTMVKAIRTMLSRDTQ